jgi:hypothetical protein
MKFGIFTEAEVDVKVVTKQQDTAHLTNEFQTC